MSKKKKGGKAKSRKIKTSQFKLNNKRTTKLAKQGKLKKRKKKTFQSNVEEKEHRQIKLEENEQYLDDDDVEFFGSKGEDTSFVSAAQNSLLSDVETQKRKRKRDKMEESEANYEQLPRKLFAKDKNQNLKILLPIKTKTGIVPQAIQHSTEDTGTTLEHNTVNSHTSDTAEPESHEPLPELSSIQLYALRQQKLVEKKRKIASLSSSVIENPEQNIKKLKELRLMLEESDPDVYLTIRKLVMVSLKEVFKDIVPGYRIRLPSKDEKQQKLKKETKELYSFEEGFLTNYRYYLEFLERSVKGSKKFITTNKSFQKKLDSQREIPTDAISSFRSIGMQCLCEMLVNHPHFNYRNNIITVIVPFMNKHSDKVSDLVCNTIRTVFREDRAGEVSLEIVRCINKLMKSRDYNVQPKVLDTFLSLRINKLDLSSADEERKDGQKKQDARKKLSKREKKRKKHTATLEHELLETKATEDKKKLQKLYTEITQFIFFVYFRILKKATKSILLPSVLEGLARFAHLINVDFFDDLFQAFNSLIESGNLSYREALHCVQTSFTILSGQGSALNVDPMRFYSHLYSALFKVHIGCSSEDLPLVLQCLDLMISRRKRQVSQQRVLAFMKRLCSVSLLHGSNSSLSLLAVVRNLILTYKYSEVLFDNESQGSGMYMPELTEPEHCNANNTALWELTLLNRHYSPLVRKYNNNVCRMAPTSGQGQLNPELSRKSPVELYTEYNMSDKIFPNDLPEKVTKQKKTKIHHRGFTEDSLGDHINSVLTCIPDTITNYRLTSSSIT